MAAIPKGEMRMDIRRTDRQLIASLARGSHKAGRQLVARHMPLAWAVARHHGLTEDDAADVCRHVVRAAREALQSLDAETPAPAWFLAASMDACRPSDDGTPMLGDDRPAAALSQDAGEMLLKRHLVVHGIEQLSERCQGLFRLLYLEPIHRSWQEIAGRLDLSVEQIRPTRALCMRHLHNALNQLDYPWQTSPAEQPQEAEGAPPGRCALALETLVNHVIGDGLDAVEATKIKDHLDRACDTCIRNMAWIGELVGVLDRGPLEPPPAALMRELGSSFESGQAQEAQEQPEGSSGQWQALPESRRRNVRRFLAQAALTLIVLTLVALGAYAASEFELSPQPARVTAIQYRDLEIKGASEAPWLVARAGQYVTPRASMRVKDGAVAQIVFPGGATMRAEWDGEWFLPRIEASRNGRRAIVVVRQAHGRASYSSSVPRDLHWQQFQVRVPDATLELVGVATVETENDGSTLWVHQGTCDIVTADARRTVSAGQTAQINSVPQ